MIAIHRWRGLDRRDLWWILPGGIGFLLAAGYGSWLFDQLAAQNGPAGAYFRAQPWFLLAYLIFLILATSLAYRLWAARRYVAVDENGLRWRLKGFRVHSLAWNELDGIAESAVETKFFSKTVHFENHSILYPRNGAPVELDEHLDDLAGLIEAIKAQYYPRVYPELLEAFNAGRLVHFGPLAIQNQALQVAKSIPTQEFLAPVYQPRRVQTVPWTQNLGLSVHSGFLVVKSGNSTMKKIPVSQIPNFEILLKMIEQGVKT
jgi:hypothetical protein